MNNEIISLREFARRLNVGEKTIRDGIKLGKISKGLINKDGKPKINYKIALEEAKASGLGNLSKIKKGIPTKKKSNADPEKIDQNLLSFNEAIKKKENYLAKLKELEFHEKEGRLVNAEIVYTTLIDFANIKRNNLLSLPDRITDDLMAITDRNEFHKLLFDSISDELEKLSELKGLEFSHE